MGQKLDKAPRGAYDAIVYIEGSEVVAEDGNGRKIASGVAGTDDTDVAQRVLDVASPGDIIHLRGEFSPGDVSVNTNGIQLVGALSANTTTAKFVSGKFIVDASNVIIQGIHFLNCDNPISIVPTATRTNVKVLDCYFMYGNTNHVLVDLSDGNLYTLYVTGSQFFGHVSPLMNAFINVNTHEHILTDLHIDENIFENAALTQISLIESGITTGTLDIQSICNNYLETDITSTLLYIESNRNTIQRGKISGNIFLCTSAGKSINIKNVVGVVENVNIEGNYIGSSSPLLIESYAQELRYCRISNNFMGTFSVIGHGGGQLIGMNITNNMIAASSQCVVSNVYRFAFSENNIVSSNISFSDIFGGSRITNNNHTYGPNVVTISPYPGNVIKNNSFYITASSGSSTGTGSEQTIAHGLAAIPTGCKAWIKYLVGARYHTEEIDFDATNIYPTVPTGIAYEWRIE